MKYQLALEYAREHRKNPTKAERYFWDRVRNRKLRGLKFKRQFIVRFEELAGNQKFFIADFYCHEKKLVVEIDGEIHNLQKEYDEIREETLKGMGYKVIRFTNEEVLNNWQIVTKKLAEI